MAQDVQMLQSVIGGLIVAAVILAFQAHQAGRQTEAKARQAYTHDLTDEVDSLRDEVRTLRAEVNSYRQQFFDSQAENQTLRAQVRDLAKLRADIGALQVENDTLRQECAHLAAALEAVRAQMKGVDTSVETSFASAPA